MATGDKKYKHLPTVGACYKHYKGGRYKVLTLAEHSELDEFKDIFATLEGQNISDVAQEKLAKLKSIVMDDLIIYRSTQYGSTHARPLQMWSDKVQAVEPNKIGNEVPRFIFEHGDL